MIRRRHEPTVAVRACGVLAVASSPWRVHRRERNIGFASSAGATTRLSPTSNYARFSVGRSDWDDVLRVAWSSSPAKLV